MPQQKHIYNVTFKTTAGIMTRMIDADNQWQAKEKIKGSYAKSFARGDVKIISAIKIK
ncbi:MAG: hypothetical protein ACTTGZ_02645 [Treponema sp.]